MVSALYFSASSTISPDLRSFRPSRNSVGRDQSKARVFGRAQLRFEIGRVVVLVTKALRFAQADAVDDAA